MIECGKTCSLGKLCGNRRFQNRENAAIEVFKTERKGIGLRAVTDIEEDAFIMEYVGEVLDTKGFRKRAKRYARDDVLHFYFMALSVSKDILHLNFLQFCTRLSTRPRDLACSRKIWQNQVNKRF